MEAFVKKSLILVAGMPATGKSTLAKKLGAAFGLPVLEKDEIKEGMFDTIGYADLAAKRQLDKAAAAVLLRVARAVLESGSSAILVNNFDADMRDDVQAMIDACDCRAVTVFLNGDADVLYERYVARDKKKVRHPGHTFINRYPPKEGDVTGLSMTREYFAARFEGHGMADFRIDGARFDVDATHPETIDAPALIAQIRSVLNEGEQRL